MDGTEHVRLIDELGRVVLPVEVRRAMDWGERTPVEIRVNSTEQEIVIKRHAFTCMFCGATEDLKEFRKKHICSACQGAIAKL